MTGLPGDDSHDVDLWKLCVPVLRDRFKDQPELAVIAWFERICGDGLGVDLGFAGADERDGQGFEVRWHALVISEEDLNSDCRDGLASLVGDVAIEEGALAA